MHLHINDQIRILITWITCSKVITYAVIKKNMKLHFFYKNTMIIFAQNLRAY